MISPLSKWVAMFRYRHEEESETLFQEIAYVLGLVSEPLLSLFMRTLGLVQAQNTNAQALPVLFGAVRLICRVYLSLNSQEHPDFFASKVGDFWSTFLQLLQ